MSQLESLSALVKAAQQALGRSAAEPVRNRAMRRGKYRNVIGTQRANRHHRERLTRSEHAEAASTVGPAMSARIRARRHARQHGRANLMR